MRGQEACGRRRVRVFPVDLEREFRGVIEVIPNVRRAAVQVEHHTETLRVGGPKSRDIRAVVVIAERERLAAGRKILDGDFHT